VAYAVPSTLVTDVGGQLVADLPIDPDRYAVTPVHAWQLERVVRAGTPTWSPTEPGAASSGRGADVAVRLHGQVHPGPSVTRSRTARNPPFELRHAPVSPRSGPGPIRQVRHQLPADVVTKCGRYGYAHEADLRCSVTPGRDEQVGDRSNRAVSVHRVQVCGPRGEPLEEHALCVGRPGPRPGRDCPAPRSPERARSAPRLAVRRAYANARLTVASVSSAPTMFTSGGGTGQSVQQPGWIGHQGSACLDPGEGVRRARPHT